MSYNGSGTFLINTAGQPVVSGTVISSTAFNALTADLATGLSTAITKDGQTTITANIPMANYKFTGLGTGSAAGDSANLSQVQSTAVKLLASVSGADTITAVGSPNVAAYVAGQMFYFVAAGANTGAVTINIDSLGAKSITRDGTTALAAGDIQSGEVCVIVYDGTQFQLVNGASQSASIVTENLTVNKATVLNESGGDNDTRIEGDTDSNLLFVDASTDRVGVGTNAPAAKLDVAGIIRNNGSNVNLIKAGTTGTTAINFGDTSSGDVGQILYDHDNNLMRFGTNDSARLWIDSSGNLGLGVTPSAWNSGYKGIDITTYGAIYSRTATNSLEILTNAYRNSSADYIYKNNGTAQYIEAANGAYSFYSAASGTAGGTITFGDAKMTLDASFNLLVGATTSSGVASQNIEVTNASSASYVVTGGSNEWSMLVSASSDSLRFYEDSTERARLTSGGDFIIGSTVAPVGAGLAVNSGISSSNTTAIEIQQNTTGAVKAAAAFGVVIQNGGEATNAADLYFSTASNGSLSERARLTSGGELLVGKTSDSNTAVGIALRPNGQARFVSAGSASDLTLAFFRNGSASEVGSIATTSTATTYNTSSDRRLKENIAPADDAGAVIDAIEIVKYDWKAGGHTRYGAIAQDLHAVAPEAVTVGDDGEEVENTWGVDYGKLVPMLVKEVQSLRKRVAELEAK